MELFDCLIPRSSSQCEQYITIFHKLFDEEITKSKIDKPDYNEINWIRAIFLSSVMGGGGVRESEEDYVGLVLRYSYEQAVFGNGKIGKFFLKGKKPDNNAKAIKNKLPTKDIMKKNCNAFFKSAFGRISSGNIELLKKYYSFVMDKLKNINDTRDFYHRIDDCKNSQNFIEAFQRVFCDILVAAIEAQVDYINELKEKNVEERDKEEFDVKDLYPLTIKVVDNPKLNREYNIDFRDSDSVLKPLQENRHLLLYAPYGAGKSTYLQAVKHYLMENNLSKNVFFADLKMVKQKYSQYSLLDNAVIAPIQFFCGISQHILRNMNTQRTLLLDGLDEVPDDGRSFASFVTALFQEIDTFKENGWRILLAIRGNHINRTVKEMQFVELTLSELSEEQCRRLLEQLTTDIKLDNENHILSLMRRPVYYSMLSSMKRSINALIKQKRLKNEFDIITAYILNKLARYDNKSSSMYSIFLFPMVLANGYRKRPFSLITNKESREIWEKFKERCDIDTFVYSIKEFTSIFTEMPEILPQADECLKILINEKILLPSCDGYYFAHNVLFCFYSALYEVVTLETQRRLFRDWKNNQNQGSTALCECVLDLNIQEMASSFFKQNYNLENDGTDKKLIDLFDDMDNDIRLSAELVAFAFSAYQIFHFSVNDSKEAGKRILSPVVNQIKLSDLKKLKADFTPPIWERVVCIFHIFGKMVRIKPENCSEEQYNEFSGYLEVMKRVREVSTATTYNSFNLDHQIAKFELWDAHYQFLRNNDKKGKIQQISSALENLEKLKEKSDLSANLVYIFYAYPSLSLLCVKDELGVPNYKSAFGALCSNYNEFRKNHFGKDLEYQQKKMIRMLLFGYIGLAAETSITNIRENDITPMGAFSDSMFNEKNIEAAEFLMRELQRTKDFYLSGLYDALCVFSKNYKNLSIADCRYIEECLNRPCDGSNILNEVLLLYIGKKYRCLAKKKPTWKEIKEKLIELAKNANDDCNMEIDHTNAIYYYLEAKALINRLFSKEEYGENFFMRIEAQILTKKKVYLPFLKSVVLASDTR